MAEPADNSQEQENRFRTQQVIDELLAERLRMLSLYCKVAGLQPFTHEKSITDELKEFCQILVDYTALVHFEVLDRIAEGKERRRNVLKVAESVQDPIMEYTQQIVDFNDKYDESDHQLILDHLTDDLSKMGEILAARAELEDHLIAALVAPKN